MIELDRNFEHATAVSRPSYLYNGDLHTQKDDLYIETRPWSFNSSDTDTWYYRIRIMGSQTIYEVGHKSFGKAHYGMAYVRQYVLNNITQYIVGHTTNNAEMYALSSTDIILCIVIITAY